MPRTRVNQFVIDETLLSSRDAREEMEGRGEKGKGGERRKERGGSTRIKRKKGEERWIRREKIMKSTWKKKETSKKEERWLKRGHEKRSKVLSRCTRDNRLALRTSYDPKVSSYRRFSAQTYLIGRSRPRTLSNGPSFQRRSPVRFIYEPSQRRVPIPVDAKKTRWTAFA